MIIMYILFKIIAILLRLTVWLMILPIKLIFLPLTILFGGRRRRYDDSAFLDGLIVGSLFWD